MDTSPFPWEKLLNDKDHNGGQSFEEIALGYVESNYHQYNWEKTQRTHDGNRDAYAVLSLFSAQESEAEAWMEAKFSIRNRTMSRYTIDKTIVSALCEGNVSELFFVTNMLINTSVKKQVLSALKVDGFGYKDVHFCAKYDLETWLTNDSEGMRLFSHFFKGCLPNEYRINRIKILGDPSFFDAHLHNFLFSEPITALRVGLEYIAEIRVYSPRETKITINVIANNGIEVAVHRRQFDVKKFVNDLNVKITIPFVYVSSLRLIITDGQDSDEMDLSVKIHNTGTLTLVIEDQEAIRRDLLSCYSEYVNHSPGSMVKEIVAQAGMGKSYLLRQITGDRVLRNESIISNSFSSVSTTNYRFLAELYLHLFYFSVSIAECFEILDSLNVPNALKHFLFLLHENAFSDLEEWMEKSRNEQLIPMNFQKDRIIVLDNTERLTEGQTLFLISLINGICSSNSHSFIVISGRHQLFFSTPQRIVFQPHDIIYNLNKTVSDISTSEVAIIAKRVYDISSLVLFIEKLCDVNIGLESLLATFDHNLLIERMITEKINGVLSTVNKKSQELLMLIYTLTNGLPYSQDKDEVLCIQPLIEANLVQYGTDGFIPVNSMIGSFYKAHYNSYDFDGEVLKHHSDLLNYDEKLRLDMGGAMSHLRWKDALNRSNDLMNRQDYLTTAYILEPLFSPSMKMKGCGNPVLTRLRFNYIYANTNIDTHYPIRKKLEEFANDTALDVEEESRICRIKALAEIVCFAFEDSDFSTVKHVAKEVREMSKHLNISNVEILDAMFLSDSTVLLMLCSEDKYIEAKNFLKKMESSYGDTSRMHIAKMRYARCFFHSDIDKARNILNEMLPLLEKANIPKWSNACFLDIQFLDYLSGKKTKSFFNSKDIIMKSLPQYVSLYRSNLRLLAACALVNSSGESQCDLSNYKHYWYEYNSERGCRFQKEIGFDYLIEAALEYLLGDFNRMQELLSAAKPHFQLLGVSYRSIIEHNITIPYPCSTKKRVCFFNSTRRMNPNFFYLDPRIW